MRRTIKHTLIITSTETWTISFESRQPIETVQTEETLPPIAHTIDMAGGDRPFRPATEREDEEVQSVDEAHSTNEERSD